MGGKHYTQEQKDFIKDNIDKNYKEIRELFEVKFGRSMNENQLDHFVQRYGLRHGKRPSNIKDPVMLSKWRKISKEKLKTPFVHINVQKDRKGRDKVIILDALKDGEYKRIALARLLWSEFYNETLSSDEYIIHIDGDNLNNEISNLRKVTRGEYLQMCRLFGDIDTEEVFSAALQIVRLKTKANKIKEKRRK